MIVDCVQCDVDHARYRVDSHCFEFKQHCIIIERLRQSACRSSQSRPPWGLAPVASRRCDTSVSLSLHRDNAFFAAVLHGSRGSRATNCLLLCRHSLSVIVMDCLLQSGDLASSAATDKSVRRSCSTRCPCCCDRVIADFSIAHPLSSIWLHGRIIRALKFTPAEPQCRWKAEGILLESDRWY